MRAVWKALGLALLAGSAIAAAPAPVPASTTPLVGSADFISLAGEPFRSTDALSGAEHWFQAADADHDGRMTLAECQAEAMRFFDSLDVDHDGQIGPDELERYETKIAPEIGVISTGVSVESHGDDDSAAPAQPPYPDRLGAGRYGYVDLPEPIVAMDANFDRAISRAEFSHAVAARFKALDVNGDGALTRDELPKLSTSERGEDEGKRRKHRR